MGQLGREGGFGCKGISRISSKSKERPHACQTQKQSRAGVYFCSEPPDPAVVLAGREEAAHHGGTWLCSHHSTAGL